MSGTIGQVPSVIDRASAYNHPTAMQIPVWIALFLACILQASATPARPLEKIEKCIFVPTGWADGDSFLIRTPAGQEYTIRLYGADCMEWHVSDETDARRLRAQRRYFGITDATPKASEAIEVAKGFGKAAAESTSALLGKPFTVYTHFRDALGDGKHQRFYAFVQCDDGADLAAELVKKGLARAFGVYAEGPDGRSPAEYEKALDDLELRAAKRGLGIWSRTNWDQLPVERKAQRQDDDETSLAIGVQKLKLNETINPNTASRDQLMKLPGIKEAMANRIIQNRPYAKSEDLLEVPGIGPKKLEVIRPFLVFSKP